MNILVVGSGGREHAICYAFGKSSRVSKIFCAPGNAGIAEIAECVPIEADNIDALASFAGENKIDLTFVGGESALALGIVDLFESHGLRIIGASKRAAELESSKAFAKDFMKRHGVPTAEYALANSTGEAISILESGRFGGPESPVVVKADGLAAGKGVVVAANRAEAITAVDELEKIAGREAASRIVVEECLTGREVSLLMFADGEEFALMPPTRDHKRLREGDTGPNTGGMGTITDASLLTEIQIREITETMIRPSLRGCISEGFPFRGVLFLGLMMTDDAHASTGQNHPREQVGSSSSAIPRLLEYNVRFGDPETQSILVRLDTDFVEVCEAMLAGRLKDIEVFWKPGNSATVVLAAEGYPQSPRKGDPISGLAHAASVPDVTLFHAGTELDNGQFTTSGGRVLGVTAVGNSLESALDKVYSAAELVSWQGMQYRRDIGRALPSSAKGVPL